MKIKLPEGGYGEASFAKGKVWTRRCQACGFDNGGYISTEKPYVACGICVMCESPMVVWKDTGEEF